MTSEMRNQCMAGARAAWTLDTDTNHLDHPPLGYRPLAIQGDMHGDIRRLWPRVIPGRLCATLIIPCRLHQLPFLTVPHQGAACRYTLRCDWVCGCPRGYVACVGRRMFQIDCTEASASDRLQCAYVPRNGLESFLLNLDPVMFVAEVV